MDLRIEIPHISHSDQHCMVNCPKNHHHTFDWEIVSSSADTTIIDIDLDDIYKDTEEFIYIMERIHYYNTPYFKNNTRVLIKRLILNNNLKRLYLLTKQANLWFRSYIDLFITESEYQYYDMNWSKI